MQESRNEFMRYKIILTCTQLYTHMYNIVYTQLYLVYS